MADESQSGGVKYIIWVVIGIIAILVTVKELGFNPTKVTVGPGSVELANNGGIAPPKTDNAAATQNTAQLESRVHQIEQELNSKPPQPSGSTAETPATPQNETTDIRGTWTTGLLTLQIQQNGDAVATRSYMYGALTSVGQGTLNGRRLTVSYVNNLMLPGRFDATLSPDGRQMSGNDYGKGFAAPFTMTRVQ